MNGWKDGKFNDVVTMIVDCVIVNFLWMIFSIPVITIGASTAAACHTLNKVVRNSEGTLWKEFIGAFKSNFKQATVIWVLTALVEGLTFLNYRITYMQFTEGYTQVRTYFIMMAFMAFFAIWFISACAYITKFDNPLKLVIVNSIKLFAVSLKDTALIFAVLLAGIILMWCYVRLMIVVPAFMLYFAGHFFNNIYEICIRNSENQ